MSGSFPVNILNTTLIERNGVFVGFTECNHFNSCANQSYFYDQTNELVIVTHII